MNKRIKELYNQSLVVRNDDAQWIEDELDPEKFAELIVKETIDEMITQMYHYGIREYNPQFYKMINRTIQEMLNVSISELKMKPHYTNTNNPIDFPKSENKMNERIKELEKQCWDNQTNHLNAEKFAWLIAYECMDLALGSSHREDDMGAIIANKIKEHFGVEE